jgi:hypothetical protein
MAVAWFCGVFLTHASLQSISLGPLLCPVSGSFSFVAFHSSGSSDCERVHPSTRGFPFRHRWHLASPLTTEDWQGRLGLLGFWCFLCTHATFLDWYLVLNEGFTSALDYYNSAHAPT